MLSRAGGKGMTQDFEKATPITTARKGGRLMLVLASALGFVAETLYGQGFRREERVVSARTEKGNCTL